MEVPEGMVTVNAAAPELGMELGVTVEERSVPVFGLSSLKTTVSFVISPVKVPASVEGSELTVVEPEKDMLGPATVTPLLRLLSVPSQLPLRG